MADFVMQQVVVQHPADEQGILMLKYFAPLPQTSQVSKFQWFLCSALGSLLLIISGCSQSPQLVIEHQYQSENRNDRIRFIVLHYTAGNWQQSLHVLTEPGDRPVSAHYLIPQSNDATYPANTPLKVYQLVAEHQRAWHAGDSRWEDRSGLNDHSIGIELVNTSWCEQLPNQLKDRGPLCVVNDFDPAQLQLLLALLKDILTRNPDITPTRVLGHSDIVPIRKQDPGSRFPWQWLASHGIGAWYDVAVMQRYWQQLPQLPDIATIQRALKLYGYGIEVSGEHDEQSRAYLLAFQRHFVPEQLTGEPDLKTVAVLWALLEKYFQTALQRDPSLHLSAPAADAITTG